MCPDVLAGRVNGVATSLGPNAGRVEIGDALAREFAAQCGRAKQRLGAGAVIGAAES